MNDQTEGSGGVPAQEPGDPFDIVFDEDFVRAASVKESETRIRMVAQRLREQEAERAEQRRAAAEAAQARRAAAGAGGAKGTKGGAGTGGGRLPGIGGERVWPRNLLVAGLAAAVAAAVIILPKQFDRSTGTPSAASPTGAAAKAPVDIKPGGESSGAAGANKPWTDIDTTTAFPDSTVQLGSLTLDLVDAIPQNPCDNWDSTQMEALIHQGSGCSQLLTALYTTPDYKAQFTIDILTFNKAEDASTVFAMAKAEPLTYQMGSLDPPSGSDVPIVPQNSAGITNCLMAVRSVVFVNAQWVDPTDQDAGTLTTDGNSLLQYAYSKVSAYEQAQAK